MNYKRLGREERNSIQNMLDSGDMSFSDIAATIGRTCQTISAEVKRYRTSEVVVKALKDCAVCPPFKYWYTGLDYASADEVALRSDCKRLLRAPLCCNGCTEKKLCGKPKLIYSASIADRACRELKWRTRTRAEIPRADIDKIMNLVDIGRSKGETREQIYKKNLADIHIPRSSFYRMIAREDAARISKQLFEDENFMIKLRLH